VHGAENQGPEHEHVEGTLQKLHIETFYMKAIFTSNTKQLGEFATILEL
jgi:hypothetical protein